MSQKVNIFNDTIDIKEVNTFGLFLLAIEQYPDISRNQAEYIAINKMKEINFYKYSFLPIRTVYG
jgi:hypothetical protein